MTNVDSVIDEATDRLINCEHPDAKALLQAFLAYKRNLVAPNKEAKLRDFCRICLEVIPAIEFKASKN